MLPRRVAVWYDVELGTGGAIFRPHHRTVGCCFCSGSTAGSETTAIIATQTPMATNGAQEYTEAGEQTPEKSQKVRYNALIIKNAKTIRKRIGATRWTQKLAKALEYYLRVQRELPEEEYVPGQPALEMQVQIGEELAADVWSIILDCDDPWKKALK